MHKESDPMAYKDDDDDARRKGKQPLIEDDDDQDQAAATALIMTTTPPSDPSCSTSGTKGRQDHWTSSSSRAPIKFHHGYHFAPRDDELIRFYLDAKLSGRKLPLDLFNDVQLYDHNPKDLVDMYREWGDDRWYFFTPRVRKYPNGSRPNRTTKEGFWKATGTDKPIKYKGSVIGLRKSLVYYERKPSKVIKTEWVMYEYTKTNANNNPNKANDKMKLDDWVLCSIQMTRGAVIKQNKKRKLHQVHGETATQSPDGGLTDDFTERLNLHQLHGESSDQDNQNNDEGTLNQLRRGYYELDPLENQHSSCGIMEVAHDVVINNGDWFHEIAPNKQLQQSFTPDQLMPHSSTPIANDSLMVNGDGFYGQFAPHQQISSMEGQINNGDELYSVVASYVPHSMAQPANYPFMANVDEFSGGVYPHQQMSSMEGGDNNESGFYGGVATNQQMPDSSTTTANYTFMVPGDGFNGRVATNQQMSFMMAGTTNGNRFSGEALNDIEHGSSEYDHPRHESSEHGSH